MGMLRCRRREYGRLSTIFVAPMLVELLTFVEVLLTIKVPDITHTPTEHTSTLTTIDGLSTLRKNPGTYNPLKNIVQLVGSITLVVDTPRLQGGMYWTCAAYITLRALES